MARPNPTWRRRPPNIPWCAYQDEQLIDAVRIGVIVEVLPYVFTGHDFGDILHRRKVLIDEGRVRLAKEI